jgi:hypothetical protein
VFPQDLAISIEADEESSHPVEKDIPCFRIRCQISPTYSWKGYGSQEHVEAMFPELSSAPGIEAGDYFLFVDILPCAAHYIDTAV